MKCNLADICEYAKDKIDVTILDEDIYISTENMMPNKGGITRASSLPTIAQTQAFLDGDVLVSNIRPYFKKYGLLSSMAVVLTMFLCLEQRMA